jgi:malonyl-CoA O-methyltransferase
MLVHAGFAEPVMDMERITLTYETPARLLDDLRELGRNLHPARFAALRGRHWKKELEASLARHLADPAEGGRLRLTFEIIYGHALKPAPRVKLSAQSAVSLQDMRAMLDAGKRAVD